MKISLVFKYVKSHYSEDEDEGCSISYNLRGNGFHLQPKRFSLPEGRTW